MPHTSFHVLNAATRATGSYREELLNGREFWVVPFVSLVEGVLNGSKGPLYYPGEEISKNPGAWNGIPLTYGHPQKDGRPLPGRSPEVAEKFQLGFIYNDWTEPTRRGGEAWFDKEWTKRKAPNVYNKLERGELVGLSTGLKTDDVPKRGKDKRGRHFDAVATNYGPDHLAVLDKQRGACHFDDGCAIGLNVDGGDAVCPTCGATLDTSGNCPSCGWTPGKAFSPWEMAAERTAQNEEVPSLLLSMWDRALNALWPGQARSQVTGKLKPVGAGSGKGMAHTAAQGGFYSITPSDQDRELAQGLSLTVNPSWVADEAKWAKAKGIAEEQGRAEDWAYVTGVYKRLGGEVTENEADWQQIGDKLAEGVMPGYGQVFVNSGTGAAWYVGGDGDEPGFSDTVREAFKAAGVEDVTYEAESFPPKDGTWEQVYPEARAWNEEGSCTCKGDEDVNRNQMIAFLTANVAAWKGKSKLLENKELFDDAGLKQLVDEAKLAQNNAKVVKQIATDVGLPAETALNEMPAFIKDKLKKDDPDEEDEEVDDLRGPNPKKKEKETENVAFNAESIDDKQLDALSKRMFGRPLAQVQEALNCAGQVGEGEKAVLVRQMTANIQDDERRKAVAVELKKLPAPELKARHQLMVDNGLLTANAEPVRRGVYGGEFVEDQGSDVENVGADETFDVDTAWNEGRKQKQVVSKS